MECVCWGSHCKTHTQRILNTKSFRHKMQDINMEIILFHLKRPQQTTQQTTNYLNLTEKINNMLKPSLNP